MEWVAVSDSLRHWMLKFLDDLCDYDGDIPYDYREEARLITLELEKCKYVGQAEAVKTESAT